MEVVHLLVEWSRATSGPGCRLDGGYHRPVCVETVVGPLHHFSVEGRQQHCKCAFMENRDLKVIMTITASYICGTFHYCFWCNIFIRYICVFIGSIAWLKVINSVFYGSTSVLI